jgi:hypothetical protein
MEHFHRAARDAIGLAQQHAARLLLDDASLDVGKRGQLCRERQPCRPAADDQDIDLLGNRTLCTRGRISLRRVEDLRVTRLESIQVELHNLFPSLSASAAARRLFAVAPPGAAPGRAQDEATGPQAI